MIYAVIFVILAVIGTAAYAGFRAAPYVPTRNKEQRRMLELAGIRPGERVYDLGSGDGRLVLAAAKEFGARATGYEISILPYVISVLRKFASRASSADFRYRDFLRVDLSDAGVILCFLTPEAMQKLGPKLARELKPGSRVVSLAFRIPALANEEKNKPETRATPIFVYRMPDQGRT